MFETLEADIVVFQETKIQRKDLTDDMVLVPGWDCYWSLPRYKKGYSGVVIYTRQSVCAPIKAEEGITGILCPPNSSTSFFDLPEDQQIGGYPTEAQLAFSNLDAATVDSEGRCVCLEFPAFILIGVYCPAQRDESRDDFRLGFLNLLDSRVRNLVAAGKNVVLTGDLNISREEIDTANAEANMRKNGMTAEDYFSTPSRRLFNQLLTGSKIMVQRDEGRECPVMWDICRAFHPRRHGMFTCWEQKVNARPGNHGARIDYVLCSLAMKDWFSDSNIQEGLMVCSAFTLWFICLPILQGSDHCPVYAVIKDRVPVNDTEVHILDMMNPPGMYSGGQRQREYTKDDQLALSGKLIPEFDGRRNIRDMFTRRPSVKTQVEESPSFSTAGQGIAVDGGVCSEHNPAATKTQAEGPLGNPLSPASNVSRKRSVVEASAPKSSKRPKQTASATPPAPNSKGQKSLKGFFKPKTTTISEPATTTSPCNASFESHGSVTSTASLQPAAEISETDRGTESSDHRDRDPAVSLTESSSQQTKAKTPAKSPPARVISSLHSPNVSPVHDPVITASSWSKLFAKPIAPRCESHDEPCKSMQTKKPGINNGRSFWMCARPLGPSGMKERGTQWRCGTFIWCSDWNSGKEDKEIRDEERGM